MVSRGIEMQADMMINTRLAYRVLACLREEKERRKLVEAWRTERAARPPQLGEDDDDCTADGPAPAHNPHPPPAILNLAHILHIGRLIENGKETVPQLNEFVSTEDPEAQKDGNDWKTLYDTIIVPEMTNQQASPPELNGYGGYDSFSDISGYSTDYATGQQGFDFTGQDYTQQDPAYANQYPTDVSFTTPLDQGDR